MADPGGTVRGHAFASYSNFFHFHGVLGKKSGQLRKHSNSAGLLGVGGGRSGSYPCFVCGP